MLTNSIDAPTLRKWSDDALTIAAHCGTGLAATLAASIQLAADAAERDEAAFAADMEAEFLRQCPHCGATEPHGNCESCAVNLDADTVLNESARTGEACGIVRRKEGAV